MQVPPIQNGNITFGYSWHVKKLYDKGKLPTVKFDNTIKRKGAKCLNG